MPFTAEEREKVKDKGRDLVDDAYEKAIEKLMKMMIERLMKWDDSGWWSKAYKAFYAPQIKILTKLILTEFKYDPQWTEITRLRHEVDDYTRVMQDISRNIQDPPFGSRGHTAIGRKMLEIMDAMLQGNINLLNGCVKKTVEMNQLLEIHKPKNIFDLVMGVKTNGQARNGYCDSVKSLISITEDLAVKRNRWAALEGLMPKRTNFRQGMQDQCPETIF